MGWHGNGVMVVEIGVWETGWARAVVVIGTDVVCGVGRHGNGVVVVEIGMWETG